MIKPPAMKKTQILLILALLTITTGACRKTIEPEAEPGEITGIIFLDKNENGTWDAGKEKGLRDVAVSNGRDIALTDKNGIYSLPLRDNCAIFVIKPRGYRFPADDKNRPQFYRLNMPEGATGTRYQGLEPTPPVNGAVNFPLYRNDEPDQMNVLVFGDTQVRNDDEIEYLEKDIIAGLVGTNASFGLTLGDIVYDNLELYNHITGSIATTGVPWVYVPGNHDLDYTGDNRTDALGSWNRNFGPDYYSFSWGPAHFVVLNTIKWIVDEDGRRYRTGLGPDQLQFFKNETERLAPDQLLVILTHIPFSRTTAWYDEAERAAFMEILAAHPKSVTLAAHTHMHYHHMMDSSDGYPGESPYHIISVGTACGSWWSGAPDEYGIPHSMMADGTPTGYSWLHIDGNDYKLQWQGARRPSGFQMQIDAPAAITKGEVDEVRVTANIFNALPSAEVRLKIGQQEEWITMNNVIRTDSLLHRVIERETALGEVPWRRLSRPSPTPHLWEAVIDVSDLSSGVYLITVESTDEWYTHTGQHHLLIKEKPVNIQPQAN
jgi:hypothetical protein